MNMYIYIYIEREIYRERCVCYSISILIIIIIIMNIIILTIIRNNNTSLYVMYCIVQSGCLGLERGAILRHICFSPRVEVDLNVHEPHLKNCLAIMANSDTAPLLHLAKP